MAKHSRIPNEKSINEHADFICSSSQILSRWLAMLNGIRIHDEFENKYGETEELTGESLGKYIDETAPRIEEELLTPEF